MADLEIDVSVGGLQELARQGKLSQAALIALNKELSALEDRAINEDRAIRKVVDALQSINVAAGAANGSSERLTSTQLRLNAALNAAGTQYDNVISQTVALAKSFDNISVNTDKGATSIKRQSQALQDLIDRTKNFQIVSNSTDTRSGGNISTNASKLAQLREFNELGNIFGSGKSIPIGELRSGSIDTTISRVKELTNSINTLKTIGVDSTEAQISSIKRQSQALQDLIDRTKNFQVLSSSTPNTITQKLADSNIGARLALQRRINEQGIISPDRIRVIQQVPLDQNAIGRIRELNAGLTQQQLLNIRIAFAARAGTDAIKGLTEAERALNIANKDVLSSEGQFAASLLGASAAAERQTNRLRQLRGLTPLGANFSGAPKLPLATPAVTKPDESFFDQAGTAAQFVILNQAALLFRQSLSFVKRELIETAQAATAFNRQILAIRSISQDSQLSVTKFGDAITNVATQFNLSLTDTAAAEYEILSQQIAKGADSFAVLTEAAKLAQVTQTSAATSAKAISAAINAYGLSAKDAERVSAVLFRTIDLGSVTLDELANSIGRTGTIARTLGISIEESAAALQALSVQGVRGEDANTQLLNIFNQILAPSKELTKLFQEQGFATGEAAVETLKFAGVVSLINERAKGSAAALKDLLGDIRAVRGGAGLANEGFSIFARNLEKTAKESIPASRAAIEDFNKNGLERLSANLNAVDKIATNTFLHLLDGSKAVEVANAAFENLAISIEHFNKAQENSKGFADRANSIGNFLNDVFFGGGGRNAREAQIKKERAAQIAAAKDFNEQVLEAARVAAIETNRINQDRIAKIQAGNFKERDAKLAVDKQITDSIINAAQIRAREIDKIISKQQEEIENSKKLVEQLEKQKKAIVDAQQVQRDKEKIEDIQRTQRTPQQLAGLRAGGTAVDQGLSDSELNSESNRRNVLQERIAELNRARLEIEGALLQPDALATDSGAVERIRKLADRVKTLSQANLDDERQKRFALDEAIFNKRQELQAEANKGIEGADPQKLATTEIELGELLRKRSEEETRISAAVKEREASFALEISVEERLAKLGKEKLSTQEAVNEQLRKSKDAQDALTELAKLEIFNKEGKSAFASPEEASKKVSQLLGTISQNTQDPELLKIANRAADRANSQIDTQRKIAEQTQAQKNIADVNEQIKKALDFEEVKNKVFNLGVQFKTLGESIDVFGDKIKKLQETLGKSAGTDGKPVVAGVDGRIPGFAQGAISINSRDTIPAMLSPGESVINSTSTAKFFNRLVSLNNGVDPMMPGGSTRFGDINVTVTGVNNPGQIADELPAAIKRVLRRRTWRN